MQFRRNQGRDERRRRAILDDRNAESQPLATSAEENRPSARNYSADAQEERRIRVVDMIPQRLWKLSLLHLATLAAVAGLLCLHYHFADRFGFANLSRPESLGTWLGSLAWLLCAGLSVLIYRIRRHRLNDYRGRYRCWLWIAPLLLLAAIDTTANVRTELATELAALSGQTLAGHEAGWWLAIWGLALTAILIRLGLETRRSGGTLFFLLLAGAFFSLHVGTLLQWIRLPEEIGPQLAQQGSLLLATWSLTTGLIQYSRFVWLDAQGLIKQRQSATASDESVETESPQPKMAAKARTAKADSPASEDSQSAAPAKRSWAFWRRSTVTEDSPDQKPAQPAAAKAPATKPAPKPSAKPTPVKPAPQPVGEEAATAKRGLFSWLKGSGKTAEQEETASAEKTVDKRPAGKSAAPANPLANPKLQAKEISSGSAKPAPATVSMNEADDDASDEEIQRLLDKPDHLLSKAERRRLKKLKRRTARAA